MFISDVQMMVTDYRGRIMYMNSDLQSMLGYTAKEVARMDMSHLMSVPYSMLHHRWMKEPSARVPPQSCRCVVLLASAPVVHACTLDLSAGAATEASQFA